MNPKRNVTHSHNWLLNDAGCCNDHWPENVATQSEENGVLRDEGALRGSETWLYIYHVTMK